MFVYIFTLALIITNIICFIKKKYTYIFFLMLLFLPDYYGIEISEKLPILTAVRIGFLVFYLYVFIYYRKNFPMIKNIRQIPVSNWFLIGYFVLRIITNLYYITTHSSALKTIFILIFEQALFCIAAVMIRIDKDELNSLLKVIAYGCGVFFLLGTIESLLNWRPTDLLYTVSREMLNMHYIRLGLLRSTMSWYIPGLFGNFCTLMLPLLMYLVEVTKQKRFVVIIGLDILATIHSGSRSSIIFSLIVFIICFVWYVVTKNKECITRYLKNAAGIIIALVAVVIILSSISPYYKYYYEGTGKSILNEFGCDFDLNAGAPPGVIGYGSNESGTNSRLVQLSGILYAARINPIFGLGSGAETRNEVYYYFKNNWNPVSSYDIGYVEVFMDEGILGFIGYILLFIYIISFIIYSYKNKEFILHKYLLISTVTYLICLLSTINMPHVLFLLIFIIISANPALENSTKVL